MEVNTTRQHFDRDNSCLVNDSVHARKASKIFNESNDPWLAREISLENFQIRPFEGSLRDRSRAAADPQQPSI